MVCVPFVTWLYHLIYIYLFWPRGIFTLSPTTSKNASLLPAYPCKFLGVSHPKNQEKWEETTRAIESLHHYISSSPHLYFYELSKTYGPLVSLKLGFVPTLVVSSPKMAKQVMKTHDHIFASRPKFANQQKISYNGLATSFAPYDDCWRAMRKLTAVHLFGLKKVQSFASIREEEAYRMTQKISRLSTDPNRVVNLTEMIMCFTNTVICKTAFGRRNNSDNDSDRYRRSGFQGLLREVHEVFVSFCFADYFPFMGWVDKLTWLSAKLDKVFTKLDGLLEEIIDEHVKIARPKCDEEDIIDVLLGLRNENSFGVEITHDHIKAIVMDIFIAGTDTCAAAVVWAMTKLMKNLKAMKRVQEEVRSSSGSKIKDMIKEEDFEELVYLKAVVKETMRLNPIAPLLLPRVATWKCNIEGYEIKENTLVFVNAWAIGRDPESWENPEEFSPERFMCENPVGFRGQDFELIPFGSGRRICPGMHMGVAMVELALANLVYSFDRTVPTGMEKEILDSSVLPGIATHKKIPLCLMDKKAA